MGGPRKQGWRRGGVVAIGAAVLSSFGGLTGARAAQPNPASPWTAAEPDTMVDRSVAAAARGGPDALARLVLATALAPQASAHKVPRLLASLPGLSPELADQARWLARSLQPGRAAEPWLGWAQARQDVGPDPVGLVRALAVLGPFEDTGGGLERRDGPESQGHRYGSADYSWGAYHVRYRRALPVLVTTRGLDLDLYVHPRKETCTYLESVVAMPSSPAPAAVLLHVASAGSFRLAWDGVEVLRGQDVHERLVVDRAAVQIDAPLGDHLLTLKVCSGAMADDGRVRLRFTDLGYQPVAVGSSSDLQRLQVVADRLGQVRPGATGAVQAKRVLTPLERGLAVGPEADASRALVAAVLRTAGGADDSRSPRAPGLLDRVAADRSVHTDELAIAGAITPSGANRSGWLGQAYERAKRQGDLGTASFAQRRLTLWRLGGRLSEQAQATLAQPPVAGATDVHARWLRARVLSQLGGTGLRETALSQLRALVREGGDATPQSVWQTVAQLTGHGHAVEHRQAMEALVALRPGARDRGYLEALRPLGAEALERAARRAMLDQDSASRIQEIGQLLLDVGRYRAGLDAFRLCARLSPNRVGPLQGEAQAHLALSSTREAAEEALAALRRAKQLEPHHTRIGAELTFREAPGEGEASGADDAGDLRFLVEPEVFLQRQRATAAKVGEQFERTLHWRRVVRLHPDKRVSQLMHYAREIVIEPRTESERYEHIPALSRQTELVRARVHRKDGSVLPPEEQETPSGAPPTVRWPKLETGDVVEVAVRSWTAGPVGRRGEMPFYFVDFVGSLDTRPVLYNEVVIDAPAGGPLAFDVIHGKADRTVQEQHDGRNITRLIWDAPPSIADEPFAPPPSELLPVVVGSVYGSWDAFLDWYRGAIEGFTKPDEQIRRLAAELTQGRAGRPLSREEKIQALHDFVADDIRYVNYVSGEWWLPNRPQQLLARRQGDCDDKAMLLISLLRAVGIDAVEVLIQTRLTSQPSILKSERVAIPKFDHGIIYLPGEGGTPGRYLDATTPESRVGALPSMDSGAVALLVREPGDTAPIQLPDGSMVSTGPARVVDTPAGSASDHGMNAKWTLSVSSDGQGALRADERHVGDAALMLRTHLRQPDARAQWIEQNLLAGWFPTAEMQPEVAFDGDLPGGAASLQYQASSRSLARREGQDLVLVLAPPMPLTARLAPQPKRTLPVNLPPMLAPRHFVVELRIEAPRSHRFAELPPDSVEDGGAFGKAQLSFATAPGRGKKGGQLVTVRREIAFEQTRIEVADYPRWRRWLQRIDRLMQRGVRLVPR